MNASILSARLAQLRERARVYEQTGLLVTDHPIRIAPRAVIIFCPKVGCVHSEQGPSEGLAVQAIERHARLCHGGSV